MVSNSAPDAIIAVSSAAEAVSALLGRHVSPKRAMEMMLSAREVPADAVHGVQQRIPHLTRGEGVFTSGLDHYAPTPGAPAQRGRAQPDPFAQIGDWTRIQRSWPAGV